MGRYQKGMEEKRKTHNKQAGQIVHTGFLVYRFLFPKKTKKILQTFSKSTFFLKKKLSIQFPVD